MVVRNGDALKRAGGADVILVTSNSYNAASEVLKGLKPDDIARAYENVATGNVRFRALIKTV